MAKLRRGAAEIERLATMLYERDRAAFWRWVAAMAKLLAKLDQGKRSARRKGSALSPS